MTWDKNKFPNSIEMIDHVAAKGRKVRSRNLKGGTGSKLAKFVCLEKSVMHNTKQTSHSGSRIVVKEKLDQSQACA